MTQSHTHKEDEALQVVTDAEVKAALFNYANIFDARPQQIDRMRATLESFAASRPVAVGVAAEPNPHLQDLVQAVAFYRQVKEDKEGNAASTGALRDANQWLRDTAMAVADATTKAGGAS